MNTNKKSIVATIRTYIRKYFFKWWWLKAVKIYGNQLHPTVRLSSTTSLDKVNPGGVIVDEYTYFSGGVIVLAHDMCRRLKATTRIGKRCFIGARSIILPGVTLGDEVIVGAGAVVTKDVPSNCIVAGNPAKVIREGIHTRKYGVIEDEVDI